MWHIEGSMWESRHSEEWLAYLYWRQAVDIFHERYKRFPKRTKKVNWSTVLHQIEGVVTDLDFVCISFTTATRTTVRLFFQFPKHALKKLEISWRGNMKGRWLFPLLWPTTSLLSWGEVFSVILGDRVIKYDKATLNMHLGLRSVPSMPHTWSLRHEKRNSFLIRKNELNRTFSCALSCPRVYFFWLVYFTYKIWETNCVCLCGNFWSDCGH